MTAALHLAHSALLEGLANELPHRILGSADHCDIAERREHLEKVLKAVGNYAADILRETNSDLPVTSTVDVAEFADSFDDLIADKVSGPLTLAENLLVEDAEAA